MIVKLNLEETTTSERLSLLDKALKAKYKSTYTNLHLDTFVKELLNEMSKSNAKEIKIILRRYKFVMKAIVYDITNNGVGNRIWRWTSKEIPMFKEEPNDTQNKERKYSIRRSDLNIIMNYIEKTSGDINGVSIIDKMSNFISKQKELQKIV